MSWFEDWFNSPLYEKLYSNRDFSEAEVVADLIEKELPVSKYSEILDLGCGRGRHSITLAKRGYKVIGIDLSKKAIEKAKVEANKERLKNVEFIVRDMRNPAPRLFDAIVNLFTTFGYFIDDQENENIIYSAAKMLKSDGILFLDYLNPTYVESSLIPSESGVYEDLYYQITRKIEQNMVYKTIQFSGQSIDEPVSYTERVKLYDLDWFAGVFQKYGFKLIETYGSYKGDPFESDSERMIMMAEFSGS